MPGKGRSIHNNVSRISARHIYINYVFFWSTIISPSHFFDMVDQPPLWSPLSLHNNRPITTLYQECNWCSQITQNKHNNTLQKVKYHQQNLKSLENLFFKNMESDFSRCNHFSHYRKGFTECRDSSFILTCAANNMRKWRRHISVCDKIVLFFNGH